MDLGYVCSTCSAYSALSQTSCVRCSAALSFGQSTVSAPSASTTKAAALPASHDARPCVQCGAALAPTIRFCYSCGAAAKQVNARGPSAELEAALASKAKLTLIRGDGLEGATYALAGTEHKIGSEGCPITLGDDPFVSKNHANIICSEKNFIIHDTSVNGIYLRVVSPTALKPGQEFVIGEQVLSAEPAPSATDEPMSDGTYFFASLKRSAHLRVVQKIRGGLLGRVIHSIGSSVSFGREGNELNFPDDPYISGRHAEVRISAGRITLHDLGSRNGTFVRLLAPHRLVDGDFLLIGQQLVRVEIPS